MNNSVKSKTLLESRERCEEVKCISSDEQVSLEHESSEVLDNDKDPILFPSYKNNNKFL